MNINSENGTEVTYIGADKDQINWGGCDDPRDVLTIGDKYTVDHTEVHSWHTKVKLLGIEGKFPSAAFD